MKIRILQANPIVGNIAHNLLLLKNFIQDSLSDQIDLIITPECYLSGYPPQDLLLRPVFQQELHEAIADLQDFLYNKEVHVLVGTPYVQNGKLYNAALHLHQGTLQKIITKKHLPNYGVFDEERYFFVQPEVELITIKEHAFGVMICEDMWHPDVAQRLAGQGAKALIGLNASPFEKGKFEKRYAQAKSRVQETGLPLLAVFQVGGQDELVFDGRSFAVSAHQEISFLADAYQDKTYDVVWQEQAEDVGFWGQKSSQNLSDEALIYHGLVMGLRDYMRKNKFEKIVLGLSGGVDSVLSAVIAVDAIKAENVTVLLLPSHYTSDASYQDAYDTISRLGIVHHVVSIEESVLSVGQALSHLFVGKQPDITEENLQSRMRGMMLMAYSNKMGAMVLTTGNKSEMATGYATLYGDMCGGYNVLKDIYKTEIYRLCHYRNTAYQSFFYAKAGGMIPENVITKAPTAELRFDQKDSDSLPEYEVLDAILEMLIEEEKSYPEIIAAGYTPEIVHKVGRLLKNAEYKRYQSAMGVKITSKAFGIERRYPISSQYIK